MHRAFAALALCLLTAPLAAQDIGTAGGKGFLIRQTGWDDKNQPIEEKIDFSPRFSYSYTETTQATKAAKAAQFQWIVLTEKKPPLESWVGVKDQAQARELWCGKEKTPFIAVKLDAKGAVDLFFNCPGAGYTNTEMISTFNGRDSVVVKLESKDPKRLKGTMVIGDGSCSTDNGGEDYCVRRGDYTFDAPRR